jgi:hypothetical protein
VLLFVGLVAGGAFLYWRRFRGGKGRKKGYNHVPIFSLDGDDAHNDDTDFLLEVGNDDL